MLLKLSYKKSVKVTLDYTAITFLKECTRNCVDDSQHLGYIVVNRSSQKLYFLTGIAQTMNLPAQYDKAKAVNKKKL